MPQVSGHMCDNGSMEDYTQIPKQLVELAQSPIGAVVVMSILALVGLWLLGQITGRPMQTTAAVHPVGNITPGGVVELQGPLVETLKTLISEIGVMARGTHEMAVAIEKATSAQNERIATLADQVHTEGEETRRQLEKQIQLLAEGINKNNSLLLQLIEHWGVKQVKVDNDPPPKKRGRPPKDKNKIEAMKTASVK